MYECLGKPFPEFQYPVNVILRILPPLTKNYPNFNSLCPMGFMNVKGKQKSTGGTTCRFLFSHGKTKIYSCLFNNFDFKKVMKMMRIKKWNSFCLICFICFPFRFAFTHIAISTLQIFHFWEWPGKGNYLDLVVWWKLCEIVVVE